MVEPSEMNPEEYAAYVQQRRVANGKRSQANELQRLVEIGKTQELLKMIGPGLARWESGIREMQASRCAGCTLGCTTFLSCDYRFRAEGFPGVGNVPICKLSRQREAWEIRESITRRRLARMKDAGIVNGELLDIVSRARSMDDALPRLPDLSPAKRDLYLRAPRKIVAAAQRFLDTKARHLLLVGTMGTFKSTAAACIVAETDGAFWLPMSKIQPSASWDAMREKAASSKLLVINDLGTEASTELHRSLVAQLITERDDNNLPMVVTANLTADQIKGGYRDSNWDRLGRGIRCNVEGLSLRDVLDGSAS